MGRGPLRAGNNFLLSPAPSCCPELAGLLAASWGLGRGYKPSPEAPISADGRGAASFQGGHVFRSTRGHAVAPQLPGQLGGEKRTNLHACASGPQARAAALARSPRAKELLPSSSVVSYNSVLRFVSFIGSTPPLSSVSDPSARVLSPKLSGGQGLAPLSASSPLAAEGSVCVSRS